MNAFRVTEKENEYKAAQRELQKVTSEKEALLKIRAEQNKALDYLKNDNEYGAKVLNYNKNGVKLIII